MKRTAFSQQGLDFVTLFVAKFSRVKISGYLPELREPAGDTTGGGVQSIQHVVLSPQIDGDPVVTVGQISVVTKTAKLRTFECLQKLHNMRFRGQPFHVDQGQYQQFFDRVLEFFRRQGMQVQIETRPPEVSASMAPPAPSGANVLIWLLMAAIIMVAVIGAYLAYSGRL